MFDPELCVLSYHVVSDEDIAVDQYLNLPSSNTSTTHELIEAKAKQIPDAQAVEAWDGQLTFGELWLRSKRLASRLAACGIGTGSYVGFCFPKSATAVLSIVAIQITGAAFVPLDPEAPAARWREILDSLNCSMVITSQAFQEHSESKAQDIFVVLKEDFETSSELSSISSAQTDPTDPSFVIFTSGSTGKPKGIVMEHQTICSLSDGHAKVLGIEQGTRVFCFSSYTFDAGIMDVLLPLIRGACVCVPSEHDRLNDLAGSITRLQANWAFFTPTIAELLTASDVPSIRTLAVGGEVVTPALADRWRKKIQFYGLYGPTEVAICAFNEKQVRQQPSIGKPISSAFWVVDPGDVSRLVPDGCIGELLIQGPLLARGYVNVEERVAKSWVTSPERLAPGLLPTKAYLTGDLVRKLPDGTFDYFGRKDSQVKLNAQRIELSEIESQLTAILPQEMRAFIHVCSGSEGIPETLAAIMWSVDGPETTAKSVQLVSALTKDQQDLIDRLYKTLQLVLPRYMIPTLYLIFHGSPERTHSGKVDRRKLASHTNDLTSEQKRRFAAHKRDVNVHSRPASDTNNKLASLWAEVLQMNQLDICDNDNFFHLGGDSVAAIKLVKRAGQSGMGLTVSNIFENPYLVEMATVANASAAASPGSIRRFSMLPQGIDREIAIIEATEQCNAAATQQIEDLYPCTPLQEGLMSISIRKPGAYLEKLVYRLDEKMELKDFQNAWEQTEKACAILRTRIILFSNGTAAQAVIDENIRWETFELSDISQMDPTWHKFEVQYGSPLSRHAIVHTKNGRYFVLAAHHAVYDGWTLRNVMDVFAKISQGLSHSQSNSFARFINFMVARNNESTATFWRTKLDGAMAISFPPRTINKPLELPVTTRKYSIHFDCPAKSKFTAATFVRASWALLMARYGETHDVCFGETVSGRNAPMLAADDVTGPMITTVPVRIVVNKEELISDYLKRVQSQSIEAIPFEQFGLQNIAKLGSDARAACDFSSLLVIQPQQIAQMETSYRQGGLMYDCEESLETENSMGDYFEYPLVLQVAPTNGSADLTLSYDSSRVSELQCHAIAKHLEHLLCQLVDLQHQKVNSLSVASSWDLEQAERWNGQTYEAIQSSITDLIHQQATESPERITIFDREGTLTSLELEAEVNRVAHRLKALGVTAGEIISICFKTSRWAIIAMLGILQANCVFMPLDPAHPETRKKLLVREVDSQFVLASAETAELCRHLGTAVLVLDEPYDICPVDVGMENIEGTASSPEQTAYILFTSGSTGAPKGVVVSHSAVCTSALNFAEKHSLDHTSRVLQFSNYSFDACIYEIFMTLMVGGTICIPTEEERFGDISTFMEDAKVNTAFLTPSFTKTLDRAKTNSLKLLVLIGEASPSEVVEAWRKELRLVNGYGPTETCVISMSHTYNPDENNLKPNIIGVGVCNFSWIVEADNHNRLTPLGCVGELLIQGPAIANGYFADLTKTNEKFLKNIHCVNELRCESVFYKTGDLVRYVGNGMVEYVGRKDTQVKLRGQRLELTEVESAIKSSTCLTIKNATAHLLKKDTGDLLIAFIEFNQRQPSFDKEGLLNMSPALESELQSLRSRLQLLLPPYMVPSLVVPLQQLPLGTTMKIDRRRLQDMANSLEPEILKTYSLSSGLSNEMQLPKSEAEAIIRGLWAQLLKIPEQEIGREDSFLELGGDSISAIHLSSLARRHDLQISVVKLFGDPRLMAVAASANPLQSAAAIADIPAPFSLMEGENTLETIEQLRNHCNLFSTDVVQDAYPCTPLQEGLLALSEKYPGSYIAKQVFRLGKEVDISRFKDAWEHVYNICDNQRIRIAKIGHKSTQALIGNDFSWEPTDGLCLDEFLTIAQNMKMSYGSKLCRSAIVKEATGDLYFVWIIHHAVFDGWTIGLILSALADVYEGKGAAPMTPYSTFISYATKLSMTHARSYWKSQLQGASICDFPPRHPSTHNEFDRSKKTTRLITRHIPFSSSFKSSITRGTILRAAWAITLARYGNTDDICFAATASGRNADVPGIERIAGTVIGTVPVRIKIDPEMRTNDLLQSIQRQAVNMVPYEQTGFQNISRISSEIKELCNLGSLLIVQPEQQVDTMQNAAADIMTNASLDEYSLTDTMEGYFTFPIVIQCPIYKNHVIVDFTYDSSLVAEPQMEALCRHFENVTRQLLSQEDRVVGDICVSSAWDLEQATYFNREVKESVVDSCLHDLISDRAAQIPEHEAVFSSSRSLTYAELDHFSSILAKHLSCMGVSLETVVPICFEKSIWAIVAMIGIIKSGGMFMPMDPSHPYSRRQTLMNQVGARYLLTSESSSDSCVGLAECSIALSESFFADADYQPSAGSCVKTSSDSAAYILFTSGSTGLPKGIVVEHSAICSSILSHGEAFGLSSSSRVLQFATYVFDVSMSEILATLVFGGTVCVPSPSERMDDIPSFINKAGADTAMITPSFAMTFSPEQVPTLKRIVLGGEAPTKDVLSKWQPFVTLMNGYAPAECCIYALAHTYRSKRDIPALLGKGMHANCWIVEPSDKNRLAPIGCIGELVIQSNTIGRGYINDQEKTAKAFVPNLDWVPPDMKRPHHQFYMSGDLVRYDIYGNIEYLGRKDTQVKLRGQRIELGEVEHCIRKRLSMANDIAVEVARLQGRETLVAFVVAGSEGPEYLQHEMEASKQDFSPKIMDASLRKRLELLQIDLQAELPSYMVPSLFIPLQRLPVLSSMKIDRRHLREIVAKLSASSYADFMLQPGLNLKKEVPKTGAERSMQALWSSLLSIPLRHIGRHDSFFQLGGDSITAIQLVSSLRSRGLALSVAAIFRDPRLCQVAATADPILSEDQAAPGPFSLLNEIPSDYTLHDVRKQCRLSKAETIEDIYPCTKLQEGLMALSTHHPGSYVARYIFEMEPDVAIAPFKAAWEEVVHDTAILRTRILPLNGQHVQTVIKGDVAWDEVTNTDVEGYCDAQCKRGLTYGTPLSQYALLGGRYFVWTVHHAISDGWTIQIILTRLARAFHGLPTPQARAFSSFIKHVRALDVLKAQEYWRKELKNAKASLFPAFEGSSQTSAFLRRKIEFNRPKGLVTTSATLLRASWAIILSTYCDTNDVCFGTTVSGRQTEIAGLDSIAGPMIATVPVRVMLDPEQTVTSFLEMIQNQALEMTPYEQYGLQNIAALHVSAADACNLSSLFAVQPAEFTAPTDGSAVLKYLGGGEEDAKSGYYTFPLVVQAKTRSAEVEFDFSYQPEAISTFQLEALSNHFQHVLSQLTTNGHQKLSNIRVAGQWDLQKAISWNTQSLQPSAALVHELFMSKALLNPTKEAIYTSNFTMSYDELDKTSSQLGHYLGRLGVGPGTVVPFCIEKSFWAVVCILGILKSGGAFMPLDPSYPAKYIQGLTEQVGASIIVTTPGSRDSCHRLVGATIVSLSWDTDCFASATHGCKMDVYSQKASSENAAYVIFSSGSTGTPKGIVVNHAASSASLAGHTGRFGMTNACRMLQFSNYVFDVSIFEILSTLTIGGTVCVPSESERLGDLTRFISASNCNTLALTPSFIRTLHPSRIPSVTKVVLAGEAVTDDVLNTWSSCVTLINAYGPAEASVYSLSHQYSSEKKHPATIGIPINCAAWITDLSDSSKLAAIGCVGELILQGPTLANKYVNDADRTRQSFFSQLDFLPSERIVACPSFYRTGDLVKYDGHGKMMYVGRRDTQVKLRGQRLELGHIESELINSSNRITHSVVEVVKRDFVDILVAFTCSASPELAVGLPLLADMTDDTRKRSKELALKLNSSLPQYMVPSHFVPLNYVPQTSSGKLDRRLLRESVQRISAEAFAAYAPGSSIQFHNPSTEEENRVRGLWAAILGLEESSISTDDNFYNIGGDSIRIISLIRHIERDFGIRIGLSAMSSRNTTVKAMASLISSGNVSGELVDLRNEISAVMESSWINSVESSWLRSVTSLPHSATVFLTGATGFLGTHILRQLLSNSSIGRVVALVRADSPASGLGRVKQTASIAGWWHEAFDAKLEVWVGDLGAIHLGLEDEQWQRLVGTDTTRNIDAIIHNGAAVNWNADYHTLRKANVQSVVELLRVAVESRAAPKFVFVSGGSGQNSPQDRDAVMREMNEGIGYTQSKFVAESIVYQVAAKLQPVQNRFSVVKPGYIIGTAQEGIANVDDFIWRVVSTAQQMGCYPEQHDSWIPIADATFVGATTIQQLLKEEVSSFVDLVSTFGLRSEHFWIAVRDGTRSEGIPVSWRVWVDRAMAHMNTVGETHPLWPVQHFLRGEGISGPVPLESPGDGAALAVKKNAEYLSRVGFFTPGFNVELREGVLSRSRS